MVMGVPGREQPLLTSDIHQCFSLMVTLNIS